MPGEEGNPLYFPCNCSGSIRYVHEGCLQAWLSHRYHHSSPEAEGRGLSHTTYVCEVCKHPFKFSAVYAENTPMHLSSIEVGPGGEIRSRRRNSQPKSPSKALFIHSSRLSEWCAADHWLVETGLQSWQGRLSRYAGFDTLDRRRALDFDVDLEALSLQINDAVA